jgi:hypothetical protein
MVGHTPHHDCQPWGVARLAEVALLFGTVPHSRLLEVVRSSRNPRTVALIIAELRRRGQR